MRRSKFLGVLALGATGLLEIITTAKQPKNNEKRDEKWIGVDLSQDNDKSVICICGRDHKGRIVFEKFISMERLYASKSQFSEIISIGLSNA